MRKIYLATVVLLLAAAVLAQAPPPPSGPSGGPGGQTADTAAPSIAINIPTASPTYSTGSAVIVLRGAASDNTGVSSVRYVMSGATSGSGSASGTSSWNFQITLNTGTTTITVTAMDAAGNSGTDSVSIAYTPPATPVNGQCGGAQGRTLAQAPSELCAPGVPSSFTETSNGWQWTCAGSGGGSSANCFAYKQPVSAEVNGICGASHGQSFAQTPSSGLCSSGTPSQVNLVSGLWMWACNGANGGASIGCSASVPSSGATVSGGGNACSGFTYTIKDCRNIMGAEYIGSCQTSCNPATGQVSDCIPVCVIVESVTPAESGARRAARYVKTSDVITAESVASDPDGDPLRLVCGSSPGGRDICESGYYYSNPACTDQNSYSVPWGDNAEHTVYCFAEDKPKGNSQPGISTVTTITITSDTIAPSVGISGTQSQWQNADAITAVICNDSNGCDASSYRLDIMQQAGACPADYGQYETGAQSIVSGHVWACAAAKDNAGNTGFSPSAAEFLIDKEKPSTSVLCNGAPCNAEPLFYTDAVTLSLIGSDSGGSGVSQILYSINRGTEKAYNGSETFSAHGHYLVEYRSVDNAGNQEDRKTVSIFVNKNVLEQDIVVNIDFVRISTDGREISVRSAKIRSPTEPINFFAKMSCYTVDKTTRAKVEDCSQGKTTVTRFDIDTKTGKRNFLQETGWSQSRNWDSTARAWRFPIDTFIYQSRADGCAEHDGVSGCGGGDYTSSDAVMEVDITYPDLQNFIVPSTPTGAPNFTRSMPIRFNVIPIVSAAGTRLCDGDNCNAYYSLDGAPEVRMVWDDFANAFAAAPESREFSCNEYHTLDARVVKTTAPNMGLEEKTQGTFFVNCVPRVTVNPLERRFVTGQSNEVAFNITVWNPLDAQSFDLLMSTDGADIQYVLEWLSLRCATIAGCTASGSSAILAVDSVSSGSVFADMSVAGRSGIYPIKFTASTGSNDYGATGTIQIFAEGLSEFSAWQMAAAVIIMVMFIWYKPEFITGRRRK